MPRQLEQIRLDQSAWLQGHYDVTRSARKYPAVFDNAGLNVKKKQWEYIAEQIQQSPIKIQWVVALDDWARAAMLQNQKQFSEQLLQIARQVDTDPWANRIRAFIVKKDTPALQQLAHKILQEPGTVIRLSPQTLDLMGRMLTSQEAEAGEWLRRARTLHPADFWLNFRLGNTLLETNPVEAAGFYRVAAIVRPDSIAVYNNLGNVLTRQNDYEGAMAAFKKALKLNNKHAPVWHNLGDAYSKKGRTLGNARLRYKKLTEAINAFNKALEIDSKRYTTWTELGATRYFQGNVKGAVEAYTKAIEVNSRYARAWFNRGNAHRDLGERKLAVADFRKAHELAPKDPGNLINLGNVLNDLRDYKEAEKALNKALGIDATRAKAWNGLGLARYFQRKYASAIEAYNEAIKIEPKQWRYLSNRGLVWYDQKKYKLALQDCKQALQHYRHNAAPWFIFIKTVQAQLNDPSVLATYKEIIKTLPDDATLREQVATRWYNFGFFCAKKKNERDAILAYEMAVDVNPRDADAWFNLGNARYRMKDVQGAANAYEKGLAIDSKNDKDWNGLGQFLYFLKQPKEAGAAYEQALKINPKNAHAWFNLGLVREDLKDLEGATHAFRKALAINGKWFKAHAALGMTLVKQGYFTQAVESWRKAQSLLAANHPLQNQVQQELQRYQRLVQMEKKLPNVLKGGQASAAELLELARMCQQYLKRYRDAAYLYSKAFTGQPKLVENQCYTAACVAALAAAGQGKDGDHLSEPEQSKLRQLAHDWLQVRMKIHRKRLELKPVSAIALLEDLKHYQLDPDLASLRDKKHLTSLPKGEKETWEKFWSELKQLQKRARLSFTETSLNGTLTATTKKRLHPLKLRAGKTYVIDMHNKLFQSHLQLQDEKGKTLATGHTVRPNTTVYARLVFTPKTSGTYHVIASSYQQQGAGAYEITVREFATKEKK